MPRHIALLRGVSPMNCRMPLLQRCLEEAGFSDVKTLLSSGNVAFSTPRSATPAALQKRVEKALLDGAGYGFMTVVRPAAHLRRLLDSDPFAGFDLPPGSKRVITFLREPEAAPVVALPVEWRDARILARLGGEVLCSYVPGDGAPGFMALLERRFGKSITTRTWETVARCAVA